MIKWALFGQSEAVSKKCEAVFLKKRTKSENHRLKGLEFFREFHAALKSWQEWKSISRQGNET